MVTSVTSFGRSGLYDWLIQRVTAVVLGVYFIVMLIAVAGTGDYESWRALFSQLWMRLFSVLALLAVIVHAWIGLWSVTTDYLTPRILGPAGPIARLIAQVSLGGIAAVLLFWGVEILWGL